VTSFESWLAEKSPWKVSSPSTICQSTVNGETLPLKVSYPNCETP